MMQKHEYTETLKDFTKGSCICDSHPNIHIRPCFGHLSTKLITDMTGSLVRKESPSSHCF